MEGLGLRPTTRGLVGQFDKYPPFSVKIEIRRRGLEPGEWIRDVWVFTGIGQSPAHHRARTVCREGKFDASTEKLICPRGVLGRVGPQGALGEGVGTRRVIWSL